MKRMGLIVGIMVAIALMGAVFQLIRAQMPQRQFSPRPGGFRVMQSVENTWAAISFEIKVDNATLEKARPHFQKAWEELEKLMNNSAGDFQAILDGMAKIKVDLSEKLKIILTVEQFKKLDEWEKETQNRIPGPGMRPNRGPGEGADGPSVGQEAPDFA